MLHQSALQRGKIWSSSSLFKKIEPSLFGFQILIYIFGFLDIDSRKTASLVCKRWLELAFVPKFAKECPLTFEKCLFRPRSKPQSIFNQTKPYRRFPYVQIGHIECDKESQMEEHDNDVSDLPLAMKTLKKIGMETTHLTITSQLSMEILSCFPNLTILEVEQIDDFDSAKLPESLHTIIVKTVFNKHKERLIKYLKSLDHLKVLKCLNFEWKGQYESEEPLSEFVKFSKELQKFLGKGKTINGTLKTSANLLSENPLEIEDITGLYIIEKFKNYDQLQKFTNLTELKILFSKCSSFHKVLEMARLKSLKLFTAHYNDQPHCDVCFTNFLESFPNVENLSLKIDISDGQIKQVFQKYPLLKKLTVNVKPLEGSTFKGTDDELGIGAMKCLESLKLIDLTDYYEEPTFMSWDLLINWPPMPTLRKLRLGCIEINNNFEKVDSSLALQHLIKQCPNVVHLNINAEMLNQEQIELIVHGWPNLRSLFVVLTCGDYPTQSIEAIIRHCKRLQTFRVVDYKQEWGYSDLKWQLDMFKRIETLREIKLTSRRYFGLVSKITRHDYHNRVKVAAKLKLKDWKEKVDDLMNELDLPNYGDYEDNERRIREKRAEDFVNAILLDFGLTVDAEKYA